MESGSDGHQFFPWRDNLEILAESIETLCTVEMTCIGPGRGIVRPLYESAREAQGSFPVLGAARSLAAATSPNDIVVLSTGVVIPGHLPSGESDGPPGIAAIAWALINGLDAVPVILCEKEAQPPIVAACSALGLPLVRLDGVAARPTAPAVAAFPDADDEAVEASAQIVNVWRPAAVVTAEKLGVNRLGVAHTSTGRRLNGRRARIERLVEAARQKGIVTVGIGDNGNEIGFGMIPEAVAEYKPYGRACQCGCGGGIASANPCDYLIVATTSNWGCYALVAMFAGLLNRPELIPNGRLGLAMLAEGLKSGALDGATGDAVLAVDGIPAEVEACVLEMLRTIIRMGLAERSPRPF